MFRDNRVEQAPPVEGQTQVGGDSAPNVRITWTLPPQPPPSDELRTINEAMARDHAELLRRARANTRRLTGRDHL